MRKKPQQQRSQAIVKTLIDATERSIRTYGLDATTTPKIAELAGVSVGSLYQYFDDKYALIEALLEQKAFELVKDLQNVMLRLEAKDFYDIVRECIRHVMQIFHQSEGLYLEIIQNWHRLPMQKLVDTVQSHSLDFGKTFMVRHHQNLPTTRLHVKIFIIVNSIIFSMMRYLSTEQPMMSEDELIDGLSQMTMKYLQDEPQSIAI